MTTSTMIPEHAMYGTMMNCVRFLTPVTERTCSAHRRVLQRTLPSAQAGHHRAVV
jgi:hypothetical protein